MVRQFRLALAARALTAAAAVAVAQAPQNPPEAAQQPAPIERAYPGQYRAGPVTMAPGQTLSPAANDAFAIPIPGVLLRVGPHSSVREVSSDAQKLELSVQRGVANINVHEPANDLLILVDLPGGQTQLLKNGLYTFDAQTNTARVLKGEALAFPRVAIASNDKPLKVKEDHKMVFNGTDVKPQEFPPYEARMDLLSPPVSQDQGGSGYYGYGPYRGYGPYGDGFYGSPYWAYDYFPWGWANPYYGYGYPFGVGIGFGYVGGWGHYGGFYGGGFRGGFGGFHGGGFYGRR